MTDKATARSRAVPQHHLAEYLSAAGRPEEALAILDRTRPLYGQFEEEAVQIRFHWLQGRIAHGLGKVSAAVEMLRLEREECRARDLRCEFLLATIDLAEAHAGRESPRYDVAGFLRTRR